MTLVQLLSGIAKIRKASATPVKPAAVKSRHTDGNWYEAFSAASISTAAVGGTILFTGASEFEKALNVALRDDIVGHSVSDFLQKWDFAQLRRIRESIKLDLGGNDAKKGVQEVVRRGWASETDLAKFHQTVNFGDDTAPGAHSRLRKPSSVTSPNSLNEAAEFLRKLLEKWILSKA